MKKVCPVCQTTLKTNCFIKDNGISTLSYLELIIKDDDFKNNETFYITIMRHNPLN